jgi:hypothetical protein
MVRFQRLQGMNVLRLAGSDQAPTRGGEPGRTGASGDSGVSELSAGLEVLRATQTGQGCRIRQHFLLAHRVSCVARLGHLFPECRTYLDFLSLDQKAS